MNITNKKTVTDIITINDIKRWTPRDIVIISAGTGTGKSYFIKNSLYQYAKENNKKILFLIHRTNCTSQFQSEIERDGKTDVIDIFTYQKIEHNILHYNKHINYKQYAYIVCDEFHYFISDADFNNTTDISFKEIMSQNCTKILMSATGEDVEKYLYSSTRRKVSTSIASTKVLIANLLIKVFTMAVINMYNVVPEVEISNSTQLLS